MATTNKDTKVITGKVRLSYVNVFAPNDKDKYSVTVLIPKTDNETLAKIKLAIGAVKASCGPVFGGKVPPNLKMPIHDGDGVTPNSGEEYGEECKGHWVINTSSKQKPNVVDARLNAVLDSTEIYSGCYGRVSINFYAYSVDGNKGIAAGLNNIQKLADGDYLGGRSRAEDDFTAVESVETDELFS